MIERYRPLARVVAILVNNKAITIDNKPKWFQDLVAEELIKVREEIKQIQIKYGVYKGE